VSLKDRRTKELSGQANRAVKQPSEYFRLRGRCEDACALSEFAARRSQQMSFWDRSLEDSGLRHGIPHASIGGLRAKDASVPSEKLVAGGAQAHHNVETGKMPFATAREQAVAYKKDHVSFEDTPDAAPLAHESIGRFFSLFFWPSWLPLRNLECSFWDIIETRMFYLKP